MKGSLSGYHLMDIFVINAKKDLGFLILSITIHGFQ